MRNIEECRSIQENISKIKYLYTIENYSILDIIKKFNLNVSSKILRSIMVANNIEIISNKGLTKDHPKLAKAIKLGILTQKSNGKSFGKNNPMYGKVPPQAKSGFRKDLGHSVRSSWEANFARILIKLNLEYAYEKYTFNLKKGDNYTPDFYILKKNKFYEIKGYERTDTHHRFIKEYPDKKLVIINEKKYSRIVKRFSQNISIEDSKTLYTAKDISSKFLEFYAKQPPYSGINLFVKYMGIHQKTLCRLFGSYKLFHTLHLEKINELDKNKLKSKCLEYYTSFDRVPSFKALNKFFPSTHNIIKKQYNSKYSLFLKELNFKYKTHILWTNSEIDILKNYFNNLKKEDILSKLPRRNWLAIKRKVTCLKIKKEI